MTEYYIFFKADPHLRVVAMMTELKPAQSLTAESHSIWKISEKGFAWLKNERPPHTVRYWENVEEHHRAIDAFVDCGYRLFRFHEMDPDRLSETAETDTEKLIREEESEFQNSGSEGFTRMSDSQAFALGMLVDRNQPEERVCNEEAAITMESCGWLIRAEHKRRNSKKVRHILILSQLGQRQLRSWNTGRVERFAIWREGMTGVIRFESSQQRAADKAQEIASARGWTDYDWEFESAILPCETIE